MTESAEERRERLKALREEASSLAGNDEVAGSPVATPPDVPGLSPFHSSNLHHRPPASPRFEFYTDPLAAFNASSQKKKKLNSYMSGSPAPAPALLLPPHSPPSPLWRTNLCNNPTSDFTPAGGFHTPSPTPAFQHDPKLKPNFIPKSNPNFTPPGKFISPGPPHYNSNVALSSSSYNSPYCNPGPSGYSAGRAGYGSQTAFGSPQPSSASHQFSGGGSGSYSASSPRPQHSSSFSANSQTNWRGMVNGVNTSGRSQGGNSSRGSFSRSPGGGRKSWTPGQSGGRASQRPHNHFKESAAANPERFFNTSMLEDPWRDLVPVRLDSVESRLNSCFGAGSSSQDWLPKSVSEKMTPPNNTKSVIVSESGPSLAESLADSFADVVGGS